MASALSEEDKKKFLDDMVRQRGGQKGRLTREVAKLDAKLATAPAAFNETQQVQMYIMNMTAIMHSFSACHNALYDYAVKYNAAESSIDTLEAKNNEAEEQYNNAMERARDFISRCPTGPPAVAPAPPPPPQPGALPGAAPAIAVAGAAAMPSRPVFQITPPPTYDPSKHEYTRFRARWEQYIGDRPDLTDAMKLAELVGRVTGEAYQAIYGFGYDGANYDAALAELESRFGDKRLLVAGYLARIKHAQAVPEMDAKALQKLVDTLKTNSTNLTNHGVIQEPFQTIASWAPKFPKKIRGLLARDTVKNAANPHTLATFFKMVQDEILIRRAYEIGENTNDPFDESKSAAQEKKSSAAAAAGTSQGDSQGAKKKDSFGADKNKDKKKREQPGCWVCTEIGHQWFKCDKFKAMDPSERYKLLKEAKGCIACLRTNHEIKDCRDKEKNKCTKCNNVHNTALHFDKPKNAAAASTSAAGNKPAAAGCPSTD